jgi:hypothetical protein
MFIFSCDRCGTDVPSHTNRLEFCNCGPCEEDYQICLWRGNYCGERGWTDESIHEWNEMFEDGCEKTFAEHEAEYAAYRDGVRG